ncbi:hypothetical protein B0H16DRAFT_359140 [Mycena metata]|uniref:Uncharacterized protein n=1 Tax=Mycena metata TaxID=1033252 RepID=A0AAD7HJQ3_9AGAR|nr:hypothetical protein B0H16DRAFT_359140 [Mycena metata]
MHKRQRTLEMHSGAPGQNEAAVNQVVGEDGFMADCDAAARSGDDDGNDHDDDGKPETRKMLGRRKLKMEFIQDKLKRKKTFSRMKAREWCSCPIQLFWSHIPIPGLLKKATSFCFYSSVPNCQQGYELSVLTGASVFLMAVSESDIVSLRSRTS